MPASTTRSMTGNAAADFAEHGVGADLDPAQRDFRRPDAVAQRIGAAGDAIGIAVDEEQRNTGGVIALARGAGADDQRVGAVAVQYDALRAVDDPAIALAGRLGQHVRQIVARLPLAMREGEQLFARGDLRQQRALLRVIAGEAQRGAGQHDRREIRLQRQRPAERLHHQHDLDAAAAEPAMLLGKRQAEQPQLGILRP